MSTYNPEYYQKHKAAICAANRKWQTGNGKKKWTDYRKKREATAEYKEQKRQYREDHKAEIKAKRKEWLDAHPDYAHDYYVANIKAIRKYRLDHKADQKAYYQKNKDRALAQSRAWRAAHPNYAAEWRLAHPNYWKDRYKNSKSPGLFSQILLYK